MLLYTTLYNKTQIYSDYLGENIYNLLDETFDIPSSYTYNVFEVSKEYIARPDLISLDAYGDTMFTDVICKLNGISNPFELNEGMKLVIPSPEHILDFTHKVTTTGLKWEKDPSKNKITKTKQSKRQTNEAIVGDTRFKVDSATGIIVY